MKVGSYVRRAQTDKTLLGEIIAIHNEMAWIYYQATNSYATIAIGLLTESPKPECLPKGDKK